MNVSDELTASIFRLNFYKLKAVLSQTTKYFVLYDDLLVRYFGISLK